MANDPFHSLSTQLSESLGSHGFSLEAGVLLAGKYRLVRPAGFGGMGVVWVARNEATKAEVAIKVLVLSREGVDGETIARFRREAHAAAQLSHRGIVRVFDLIELHEPEEALVMVMELLRGETLATRIEIARTFSLDEALAIVLPILSALGHAHAQGIVHRDLKPDNVFLVVEPDGHVIPKILDFGISKLIQPQVPRITTDGAMLGTPSYMSPEQARGRSDVDARTDVFAAGIVLYEMLAGESPFASGSYHSVVAAILERDPRPIEGLAPEVWRVLKRALEKPAALRYADASELSSALRSAVPLVGTVTPEVSGPFPASRLSVGDRSVPPAPFREPGATIPSLHVVAKKRARFLGASVGLLALGGAIVIAGVATRRPHDDQAAGTSSSIASPALIEAPSVAPATSPVEAAAAPVLAATVAAPPSTATPATASASPAAAVAASPVPPRAHTARPPAAPPPRPSKPATSPSSAPTSSVVRDPGF